MVSQSFLQVADLSQQFQGNLSNKNKSYPPGTLVNQGSCNEYSDFKSCCFRLINNKTRRNHV
jgi:hypothetical protein